MNASGNQTASFPEETTVSTIFGTVTNKRVIYNRARSWFSGGSREDIPLAHVTSVRLDVKRHIVIGGLFLLAGLSMALRTSNPVNMQLTGVLFAVFAVLLLWGYPTVYVNTAGQDKSKSSGGPWHLQQANSFVEAIRHQLVQRQ